MKNLIKYTLSGFFNWFEIMFNFDRSDFRLYRYFKGGIWYKHQMNGELPRCYGSYWAKYGKVNRYTDIIKTENYGNTNV